ncbi:MAG: carbohydrate binding domain-containing protein [Planctomycetota bacterium]|nr:carbohydrate binding domain-containing protein [Planctomycetota bacterium]
MTSVCNWSVMPALLVLVTLGQAAEPGRLTVQVDKPGPKISPLLWGIFYEEINCSGDGGLYAELIRNRNFEEKDKPDHWTLVCTGTSKAEMGIDTAQPLSEKNRRCLRLRVSEAGDGRVGVANGGWWGIWVKDGARYDLSFYARGSEGLTGPLTVTLESAAGSVYAEEKVDGITAEWKKHTLTLKSKGTDPKARLVISTRQAGTLWLDVVSLFPKETWKDHGLRPDLAEMLNGLKPSFVRFPGGCWVEGDKMEFASRWKRTIGNIGDRWVQWNIWNFFATNGLGFHEYLVMCEDLGAEPLFVINCGMSHKENVPLDKMSEFVQDALDAIEYANGPEDSTWGSVRAKAGHAKPFNMKYMEIGNENGGPAYFERYALFHDAVKAKYPDFHLIANVWGGVPGNRPIEIVDEHYYSSPEFFMQNATKYDKYKRDGYKVYIGEYAVTQGAGLGNLRGALGEAAFMTGMERNSDVVLMGSYAPLFCNANNKRWPINLINFDSSRVFGIPSYYVQKMCSENRGDVVLPVTIEPQATAAEPEKNLHGAIGVGTWVTQAEYKDIKVTAPDGKTLFERPNFTDTKGWKLRHGQWKAEDGALRQTVQTEDCRAVAGDAKWTDYTYTLKARKIAGAEGFLIMFRVEDDANWIWWNIGGWGNSHTALERCSNGGKGPLGQPAPVKVETGRWYDIRIEVKGANVRCFMDDKLVTEATDAPQQVVPVYGTASHEKSSGEVILKVVNVSDGEQKLQVDLQGAKDVSSQAKAIELTGQRMDENTLDAPTKIAPTTRAVGNAGRSFTYAFPANSFTVLRVKAER